jgi:hypothetical protein
MLFVHIVDVVDIVRIIRMYIHIYVVLFAVDDGCMCIIISNFMYF